MSNVPDDLDKLLIDVRKSIDENRLFLKSLADDVDDVAGEEEDKEDKESEVFEEL